MSTSPRSFTINRNTKETQIAMTFSLDGSGKNQIQTGIPFFDHMLDLFSHHGLFDLSLQVKGDLDVDFHHTVEDVGICMGQAFREAIGDAKGIARYASGFLPMDEALCQVAIDISNRPHLDFNCVLPKTKVGSFDVELTEEFFRAFVNNARITLHIDVVRGNNLHHIIESCFKGVGFFLDKASLFDARKPAIPSTKGLL